MHLTPGILEAAYEYLRATPPFKKWKLPEAAGVEFHVIATEPDGEMIDEAYCFPRRVPPMIQASCTAHNDFGHLLATMAHEMVHLKQYAGAIKSRMPVEHGPKFKKLAAQVCKAHGFDPNTF